MYDIIAASFFQKKSCVLPGIGQLSFVSTAAEADFSNSRINAPKQSIVFIPAASSNTPAFNEFSAISELMKNKLEAEGQVTITGIGSFTKLAGGELNFKPIQIDPVFLQPVKAERVVRQQAELTMLVGDKEITSTVMNEMLHVEEEVAATKDRGWIWAVVWLVVAVAALAFYFYTYGFNNLGNIINYSLS